MAIDWASLIATALQRGGEGFSQGMRMGHERNMAAQRAAQQQAMFQQRQQALQQAAAQKQMTGDLQHQLNTHSPMGQTNPYAARDMLNQLQAPGGFQPMRSTAQVGAYPSGGTEQQKVAHEKAVLAGIPDQSPERTAYLDKAMMGESQRASQHAHGRAMRGLEMGRQFDADIAKRQAGRDQAKRDLDKFQADLAFKKSQTSANKALASKRYKEGRAAEAQGQGLTDKKFFDTVSSGVRARGLDNPIKEIDRKIASIKRRTGSNDEVEVTNDDGTTTWVKYPDSPQGKEELAELERQKTEAQEKMAEARGELAEGVDPALAEKHGFLKYRKKIEAAGGVITDEIKREMARDVASLKTMEEQMQRVEELETEFPEMVDELNLARQKFADAIQGPPPEAKPKRRGPVMPGPLRPGFSGR